MFLDRIVAEKLKELEQRQKIVPLRELKATIRGKPLPLDLAVCLCRFNLASFALR